MKEGFEAKLLNVDINKDMKHNTPNNINFKRKNIIYRNSSMSDIDDGPFKRPFND